MKLELKHLAPYLPYGLKIKGNTYGEIKTLYGIKGESVFIDTLTTPYPWADFSDIKPILRSLSDLKKEIRHKDVDFIPVEFLIKEGFNVSDEWIESGFIDIIRSDYEFIQLLLEWHFDIHGLIENGLAIDINTLNYE